MQQQKNILLTKNSHNTKTGTDLSLVTSFPELISIKSNVDENWKYKPLITALFIQLIKQ